MVSSLIDLPAALRYRIGGMAAERTGRRRGKRTRNVLARQSIHVRLEPEQYDGIAAIMKAENRTQGDVVRGFIADGLDRYAGAA